MKNKNCTMDDVRGYFLGDNTGYRNNKQNTKVSLRAEWKYSKERGSVSNNKSSSVTLPMSKNNNNMTPDLYGLTFLFNVYYTLSLSVCG